MPMPMPTKAQRVRRAASAGKPPKPHLSADSRSEASTTLAEKTENQRNQKFRPFGWYPVYQAIRAHFDWRKAAYIAWSAAPKRSREPDSEEGMAVLLGYKASRTFRRWRQENPDIDEAIKAMKIAPLNEHLADVIAAWIDSALIRGRDGHPDRKLFLERAGLLGASVPVSDDEAEWWEASEDDDQAPGV